jgi:hypothetical protein
LYSELCPPFQAFSHTALSSYLVTTILRRVQLLFTELPRLNGPLTILSSDRAWFERAKFRRDNGYFTKACNLHFERNIADRFPDLWRNGGKAAFRVFVYAVSYGAYGNARFDLQDRFPQIWAYMLKSEADQKVYTPAELLAHDFLRESYTMMSLVEYCRLTGAAWSHHRAGEPPIHTDNTVEQGFSTDKVCKLPSSPRVLQFY